MTDIELLGGVLRKAFGARMNSIWSAWANDALDEEEIDALAVVGVEVQRNCTGLNPKENR